MDVSPANNKVRTLHSILITTDAVGGVWQYTVDLVSALSRRGHRALVCILGPSAKPSQLTQLSMLRNVQIAENTGPLEWMNDPWQGVAESGQWLLKLADRFDPDIVHLNGYSHAALPWFRPVLVAAHSCVTTWWQAVNGTDPDPEWKAYREKLTLGLKAADAVVAPSSDLARGIEQHYGLTPGRVEVIPNFSSLQPKLAFDKQPFCLAAGRFWDKAKNLDLLLRISRQLRWPIYIAGANDGRSSEANVTYLGHLEHQAFLGYLERANIFLHPALYEPFGLAVLEAARSGCALVLSDIASLREVWGDSAIFVQAGNPNSWLDAVQPLIADENKRREMARNALEHSKRYSEELHVSGYLQRYASLVSKYRNRKLLTA